MLFGLPLNIFIKFSLLLSQESSLVWTRHSWNGEIVEKYKIFRAEFGSASVPFSVYTPFVAEKFRKF